MCALLVSNMTAVQRLLCRQPTNMARQCGATAGKYIHHSVRARFSVVLCLVASVHDDRSSLLDVEI